MQTYLFRLNLHNGKLLNYVNRLYSIDLKLPKHLLDDL